MHPISMNNCFTSQHDRSHQMPERRPVHTLAGLFMECAYFCYITDHHVPGQKTDTCSHIMTLFDGHLKCVRCRDKGFGDVLNITGRKAGMV